MVLTGLGICTVFVLVAAAILWSKRRKTAALLAAHTITPEELQRLLTSDQPPKIYDVRQPLDLLAYSEIIRGSIRIPPHEILANPRLIPSEEETIVYCTCPGDETSREVIDKALSLNFKKIRLLSGGLAAWKAKGFPVDPYDSVFHLDTPA